LSAERVPLPTNVAKLNPETLRNLQTELNPVPADLLDIEFWPENNILVSFDPKIKKIAGEVLTIDVDKKVVDVTPILVDLSQPELDVIAIREQIVADEITNKTSLSDDVLLTYLKTRTLPVIETEIAAMFSSLAVMTQADIDAYINTSTADDVVKTALKYITKDVINIIALEKVVTKIAVYLIKKEL